jgi:hypothetical protein
MRGGRFSPTSSRDRGKLLRVSAYLGNLGIEEPMAVIPDLLIGISSG